MGEPTIERGRVHELKRREDERFAAEHPRSLELLARARASMPNGVPMAWLADPGTYEHPVWVLEGKGARFRDADGREYVDFNLADMSMFCGYAPGPIVEAVSRRMAGGNQFLLPVEDSIWVAEELARRWALPKWQFTLSASQANTEVIRVARVATGRSIGLMFEGKYHGHFDQALVALEDGHEVPEELGLPAGVAEQTRVIAFNDLEALERALEPHDVAVVLLEPAMTNNHGLILPDPGFHEALRRITRETGTLLAYDETHTLVCGPGGLVREWSLEPDLVSLGKSIAGGVPIGAYGMTDDVAEVFRSADPPEGAHPGVATGGTLFANALTFAAARAALGEVLTADAYTHTAALGGRLADGMEVSVRRVGLPWTIHRLSPRSGYTFSKRLPRNAREAIACEDRLLVHLIRVWLANRGVWEAIPGAGPTVSVPAAEGDVDGYVGAFAELLAALTA
ncbi:MAG TPA: transaminase [Actinomycetota bacterium]